jgi:hypothetical protein
MCNLSNNNKNRLFLIHSLTHSLLHSLTHFYTCSLLCANFISCLSISAAIFFSFFSAKLRTFALVFNHFNAYNMITRIESHFTDALLMKKTFYFIKKNKIEFFSRKIFSRFSSLNIKISYLSSTNFLIKINFKAFISCVLISHFFK